MSIRGVTSWLRPATIADAFAALGGAALAVGGGTDLALHAPAGTTTLVDLQDLGLDFVMSGEAGFRIGAMTTLSGMLEHPGLAAHLGGVLPETLLHIGSPLLRNAATLGGHLARGRLSDLVPTLLALDATITVFDAGGERAMSLESFFGHQVHRTSMLIVEVGVPAAPPPAAAAFRRFSDTGFDVATLNGAVAVHLDGGGSVTSARVALGETPRLGARVPEAERALVGSRLEPEAVGDAIAAGRRVAFGDDARASGEHRRALAAWVLGECMMQLRTRLEGGPA